MKGCARGSKHSRNIVVAIIAACNAIEGVEVELFWLLLGPLLIRRAYVILVADLSSGDGARIPTSIHYARIYYSYP